MISCYTLCCHVSSNIIVSDPKTRTTAKSLYSGVHFPRLRKEDQPPEICSFSILVEHLEFHFPCVSLLHRIPAAAFPCLSTIKPETSHFGYPARPCTRRPGGCHSPPSTSSLIPCWVKNFQNSSWQVSTEGC